MSSIGNTLRNDKNIVEADLKNDVNRLENRVEGRHNLNNQNLNNVNTVNTLNNTTGSRVQNAEASLADEILEKRAPIVREQHVYTQSAQAPEIREKHVVREQHLVQEVPIIEKKVIHERPVVQEVTIIHEKPIVHEKKVVTNERQIVVEAPIIQHGLDSIVRESPTIIRDTTVREVGIIAQNNLHNNNNLNHNNVLLNQQNNGAMLNQQNNGAMLNNNNNNVLLNQNNMSGVQTPIMQQQPGAMSNLVNAPLGGNVNDAQLHNREFNQNTWNNNNLNQAANAGTLPAGNIGLNHQNLNQQSLQTGSTSSIIKNDIKNDINYEEAKHGINPQQHGLNSSNNTTTPNNGGFLSSLKNAFTPNPPVPQSAAEQDALLAQQTGNMNLNNGKNIRSA